MLKLVLVVLVGVVIVCLFIPAGKNGAGQSPRPRRRSEPYGGYGKPHGLPWFDKNYQKWLKKQKNKPRF